MCDNVGKLVANKTKVKEQRSEMQHTQDATPAGAGSADQLELERFIPYRLAVLADWVSRSLATTYHERFGISIPEWRIIAVLSRFQPLSAGELSEFTNMDKPRVSRALQRLAAGELIKRERAAKDQRVAVIHLSDKGTALYSEIAPLALDWEQRLLEGFSAEQRVALDRLLDQLQDRLTAMRREPLE